MSTVTKLRKKLFGKTGSVVFMLVLTAVFFTIEITVGYAANSMALVTDSFHKLSDVVSLVIGFYALRYSKRSQRTERNTFGWKRAEVLGALINAVFLIAICFSILVESLKRLVYAEEIHIVNLVLVVGSAGLFINLVGLVMFYRHGHSESPGGGPPRGHAKKTSSRVLVGESRHIDVVVERRNTDTSNHSDTGPCSEKDQLTAEGDPIDDSQNDGASLSSKSNTTPGAQLNMRAVYLHILGDTLGSLIVITSGLIIKYTSGKWNLYVDPVMSILMVALILRTSIPLLCESALILLQTVPTHIKIQQVQDRLLRHVRGVLSIHDFHVWQLEGDKIIASAHMLFQSSDEYMAIANNVHRFFHNEGIHSTTIQPEFVEEDHTDEGCTLPCDMLRKDSCAAQQCCPKSVEAREEITINEAPNENDEGLTEAQAHADEEIACASSETPETQASEETIELLETETSLP